jgi:hypothetical protein
MLERKGEKKKKQGVSRTFNLVLVNSLEIFN